MVPLRLVALCGCGSAKHRSLLHCSSADSESHRRKDRRIPEADEDKHTGSPLEALLRRRTRNVSTTIQKRVERRGNVAPETGGRQCGRQMLKERERQDRAGRQTGCTSERRIALPTQRSQEDPQNLRKSECTRAWHEPKQLHCGRRKGHRGGALRSLAGPVAEMSRKNCIEESRLLQTWNSSSSSMNRLLLVGKDVARNSRCHAVRPGMSEFQPWVVLSCQDSGGSLSRKPPDAAQVLRCFFLATRLTKRATLNKDGSARPPPDFQRRGWKANGRN